MWSVWHGGWCGHSLTVFLQTSENSSVCRHLKTHLFSAKCWVMALTVTLLPLHILVVFLFCFLSLGVSYLCVFENITALWAWLVDVHRYWAFYKSVQLPSSLPSSLEIHASECRTSFSFFSPDFSGDSNIVHLWTAMCNEVLLLDNTCLPCWYHCGSVKGKVICWCFSFPSAVLELFDN